MQKIDSLEICKKQYLSLVEEPDICLIRQSFAMGKKRPNYHLQPKQSTPMGEMNCLKPIIDTRSLIVENKSQVLLFRQAHPPLYRSKRLLSNALGYHPILPAHDKPTYFHTNHLPNHISIIDIDSSFADITQETNTFDQSVQIEYKLSEPRKHCKEISNFQSFKHHSHEPLQSFFIQANSSFEQEKRFKQKVLEIATLHSTSKSLKNLLEISQKTCCSLKMVEVCPTQNCCKIEMRLYKKAKFAMKSLPTNVSKMELELWCLSNEVKGRIRVEGCQEISEQIYVVKQRDKLDLKNESDKLVSIFLHLYFH